MYHIFWQSLFFVPPGVRKPWALTLNRELLSNCPESRKTKRVILLGPPSIGAFWKLLASNFKHHQMDTCWRVLAKVSRIPHTQLGSIRNDQIKTYWLETTSNNSNDVSSLAWTKDFWLRKILGKVAAATLATSEFTTLQLISLGMHWWSVG